MIGLGAKSPEIKVQRQPEVPGSLRLRALDWATVSAASNRCVPLYHLLVSGRRHFNDTEQATVGRKQFEVALAIVLFVDPAGFDAGTQHFQDLLCDAFGGIHAPGDQPFPIIAAFQPPSATLAIGASRR